MVWCLLMLMLMLMREGGTAPVAGPGPGMPWPGTLEEAEAGALMGVRFGSGAVSRPCAVPDRPRSLDLLAVLARHRPQPRFATMQETKLCKALQTKALGLDGRGCCVKCWRGTAYASSVA